jgi:hypothetical protein
MCQTRVAAQTAESGCKAMHTLKCIAGYSDNSNV